MSFGRVLETMVEPLRINEAMDEQAPKQKVRLEFSPELARASFVVSRSTFRCGPIRQQTFSHRLGHRFDVRLH
jgi:hypothetical protein